MEYLIGRLRQAILDNTDRILFWLIVAQPILDVIAYWSDKIYALGPLVLMLRFGLLLLMTVIIFSVGSRKRLYRLLLAVTGIFLALRYGVMFSEGMGAAATGDIAIFIRVITPIVYLLLFITLLLIGKGSAIMTLLKALFVNLYIVAIVVLLSHLTDSVNYAYEYTEIGSVGWFSNDNAQGLIDVVLTLGASLYAYMYRSRSTFVVTLLTGMTLLFIHGSRIAFYSIFLIGLLWFFVTVKRMKFSWRLASVVGLVLFLTIYLVGSPMAKNREEIAANNARVAHDLASEVDFTLYEQYARDLVGVFGVQKVAEEFGYTNDVSVIRDYREQKNAYVYLSMENGSTASMLFGHPYREFTKNGVDFEPESDLASMLFLYGIVGSALYWFSILILVGLILRRAFARGLSFMFNPLILLPLVGAIALVVSGMIAGHVALRSNVTVYTAVFLALLTYMLMSRKRVAEISKEVN